MINIGDQFKTIVKTTTKATTNKKIHTHTNMNAQNSKQTH